MKTNFKDLSWEKTIIKHTNQKFSKKCIIGVPVYKSSPSNSELNSLNQLCKVIGKSYEICLICPIDLDISAYDIIAQKYNIEFSILYCAKDYFKSTETYSYLCETSQFYRCFFEYDYLFIYQLDAWIFSNLLDYYINLDVDYIGSPWKFGSFGFNMDTIGNGGVSLRNVLKFISICENLSDDDFQKPYVDKEDLFFCKTLRNKINLKTPSIKIASNFSLSSEWDYFIRKYNNGHLPMCVHAWQLDINRWKKYIKIESFDTSVKKDIQKKPKMEKIKMEKLENMKLEAKQKTEKQKNNNSYSEFIKAYYGLTPKKEKIEKQTDLNKPILNWVKRICDSCDNTIYTSDKESIVITLTSWPKRINNLHHIIDLILHNSKQPDIININLSLEEFPNKEKDLPNELQNDLKNNPCIKINWLTYNTKVWKKLIPTIYKYPNDVIISIDDDFEYPNNLIETLYNEYLKYDKKYPISGNKCKFKNIQCHCGCASLVKKEFIEPYFHILNKEIIDAGSSDIFYTYCAMLNGNEYKQSSIEFFTNMKSYRENDSYTNVQKSATIEKTFNECEKAYKKFKSLKIAVCAIAKNENLYIREWVEWYKNLGVDKIFIYDNNELDGEHFEDAINDYIKSEFVQIINVRGAEKGLVYNNDVNLQASCYIECFNTHRCEFDWIAFFDIDEFLSIKTGITIKEFLQTNEFKDTTTILVPWLMYTDNNLLYYENKHVTERFTEPIFNINVGTKSITRTTNEYNGQFDTYDCLIHTFIPNDKSIVRFVDGVKVNFDYKVKNLWKGYKTTKHTKIVLNHYRTKTASEYIKRHLGRHWGTALSVSKNIRTIDKCMEEFFKYNKRTKEKIDIFNNFNNIKNITNDRIIITLTTYPKRDMYVYNVLKDLVKNQTIKPTKIYLYLAKEEYDKNALPESIKKCINENLCEIKYTYNTYCHKRHEVFNEEYDSYVMVIDDDMLYPKTYIEELYNYSKQNRCITQYVGFYDDYIGTKRTPILTEYNNGKFSNLSGATICFPPKTFPLEALKNTQIRDRICKTCDESWIQPFLIKENRHIVFLHKWNDREKLFKMIDGSQDETMHKIMSVKNESNIRYREQCFSNVIKFLEIEEKIKSIWPKFDYEACSTIKILKNENYKIILDKNTGNIINTDDYIKYLMKDFRINQYKKFDIVDPQTIEEKINWLKIFDVTNLKGLCADKVKLHEYSKEKLGKDICIPIIKVYNSPDEIQFNELPEKFVLKCNHGYKMNIICDNKKTFDLEDAKIKCKEWLKQDFGLKSLQMHYSLIDRKCFIEQYMSNGKEGLTDYKFWCQNGIPQFIMVINDRYNGKDKIHANIYDLNWQFIKNFGWKTFPDNEKLLDKKPKTFEQMLNYAKILSKDFKFVRVDFYEVDGQCYLGELTFTPDNGLFQFSEENDLKYGKLLKIKED